MLAVVKETLGRLFYILPSMPEQAQIEITNKCNLDCNMCPRHDMGVEFKHMDFDLFKKIIERLQGVRLITLTGWGEPFIHPHIFDMIKLCKEKSFQVQLTSNGVFPFERIPEKIVDSKLDSISFSIDRLNGNSEFGHESNVTTKNIIKLLKVRNGCVPKVTVQTTMQKNGKNEICDIIRWAASAGVDRANLGRLDQRFNNDLPRPSREEEEEIMCEAEQVGKKCGIKVDCIQHSVGDGIQAKVYRVLKHALHRFGKYCLKTYTYVYINVDGDVTPCCSLPKYKIDNILQKELKNIWLDNKFLEFREQQSEICGKCDMWDIKYLS